MPIVPLPFTGAAYQNVEKETLSNPQKAIKFENMLLGDAGENLGRPGYLKDFAVFGGSPVLNHRLFKEFLVVVTSDRRIFSVDKDANIVDITGAAPLEGTNRPHFDTDGAFLAIAGGGKPKRWDGTGDTELMPGSPPDCDQVVYLDGYWLLNEKDTQEIRFAGPTAPLRETWDPNDFFQAEGLPDNVRSIAVLQREFYAFGDDSTEIYQNLGLSDVPFQRAYFIDEGTIAQASVVKAARTLFFLDEQRRFSFFNGRSPQAISTPFDEEVQKLGTVSDCFTSVIDIQGQYLLLFVFPTEERVFCFDYKRSEYIGEWNGFVNSKVKRFALSSHVYWKSQNKHYIGDFRVGAIHELTFDSKKDGDDPIRRLRRSGKIDHSTDNSKRNLWYRFTCKRGVGNAECPEPKFMVSYRDDGKPFVGPIEVSLGAEGDTRSKVKITNQGLYNEREIEVVCTDPVEFVLSRVEENVEPNLR